MQGVPRVTRSRMENSHDRLEGSVARQGGPIALMMAAGIALAACSGGDDGLSEEEEATLQEQLDQAVADAAAQKAAKETAEKAKEAAEAAAKEAAAQAAAAAAAAEAAAEAVAKAIADKEVAEAAKEEAEELQADAEAAEDEADRLRRAAQEEADRQDRLRQEAQAEQERLAQEAEDAQQLANQAAARTVLLGLGGLDADMASIISDTDPNVTPRYRAAASVTGTTGVTFVNPTTGSQGRWFRTSFSNRGASNVDRMDVYTDVDAATSVPFKDSEYNVGNLIVDAEGEIVDRYDLGSDTGQSRDDVAGSGFPSSSSGPRSYDLDSRGMTMGEFEAVQSDLEVTRDDDDDFDSADRNTQAFRDALEDLGITVSQYNQYAGTNGRGFRDTDLYPEQWNAVVSGTLGGASGRYVCSSDTWTTSCTVQKRGSDLYFVGPWTFRPSSGTVRVRVDDSTYMHFGWWSRQDISDGSWSFQTFHGDDGDADTPSSLVQIGEITGGNDVSGTATYQGPAVGYYAIYQPLGGQSGHGDFSATANLTADFDTSELHGTIDQFQGHSDWSLTLNRSAIDGDNKDGAGAANDDDDGVSWKIGDRTTDGGSWEANFYSNLVDNDPGTSVNDEARNGAVPSGIAGTFSAEYSDTSGADIGRLMGAFGAHCRTGC